MQKNLTQMEGILFGEIVFDANHISSTKRIETKKKQNYKIMPIEWLVNQKRSRHKTQWHTLPNIGCHHGKHNKQFTSGKYWQTDFTNGVLIGKPSLKWVSHDEQHVATTDMKSLNHNRETQTPKAHLGLHQKLPYLSFSKLTRLIHTDNKTVTGKQLVLHLFSYN